jgi:protein TonB
MKYHAQSLFLSLLVHAAILALLVYSYLSVAPQLFPQKEKRICVNLCTITKAEKPVQKQTPAVIKKQEHKELQKDVVAHKKRVHTKRAPKKSVQKKAHKVTKQKVLQAEAKAPQKNLPATAVTSEHKELPKSTLPVQTQPVKRVKKQECKKSETLFVEQNIPKITQLIRDNLYYPRRARKRGIEGTVIVKFLLDKEGKVSNIEIISANAAILGRASVKTISELSGKFPKPTAPLTLKVPIRYKLD